MGKGMGAEEYGGFQVLVSVVGEGIERGGEVVRKEGGLILGSRRDV